MSAALLWPEQRAAHLARVEAARARPLSERIRWASDVERAEDAAEEARAAKPSSSLRRSAPLPGAGVPIEVLQARLGPVAFELWSCLLEGSKHGRTTMPIKAMMWRLGARRNVDRALARLKAAGLVVPVRTEYFIKRNQDPAKLVTRAVKGTLPRPGFKCQVPLRTEEWVAGLPKIGRPGTGGVWAAKGRTARRKRAALAAGGVKHPAHRCETPGAQVVKHPARITDLDLTATATRSSLSSKEEERSGRRSLPTELQSFLIETAPSASPPVAPTRPATGGPRGPDEPEEPLWGCGRFDPNPTTPLVGCGWEGPAFTLAYDEVEEAFCCPACGSVKVLNPAEWSARNFVAVQLGLHDAWREEDHRAKEGYVRTPLSAPLDPRATDERVVQLVRRAYEYAAEQEYRKKCYVFRGKKVEGCGEDCRRCLGKGFTINRKGKKRSCSRGDAPLRPSDPEFQLLLGAGRALTQEGISPAVWCAYKIERHHNRASWAKGKRAKGSPSPKRPPPLNVVFVGIHDGAEGCLAWAEDCLNRSKGHVLPDFAKAFSERCSFARRDIGREANHGRLTGAKVRAIVAEYLPRGFAVELAEVAAHCARLTAEAAAYVAQGFPYTEKCKLVGGEWVWPTDPEAARTTKLAQYMKERVW